MNTNEQYTRQRSRTESHVSYNTAMHSMRDIMTGYNENINLYLEIMQSLQRDLPQPITPNIQIPTTQTTPNIQIPITQTTPNVFSRLFTFRSGTTQHNFDQNNLQDVVVRPTAQQITNAIETFVFNEIDDEPSRCPITLEDFTDDDIITRIKPCGHTFSTPAINNWFNNHVRCPVCRYDIRDYMASTDNSNNPITDISNNTMPSDNNNTSIETTMQELTTELTNMMANYFTNNLVTSNPSSNAVYRFEIPIVTTTTYTEDEIQDDMEVD